MKASISRGFRTKQSHSSGFTLIELLVVIAIIAILAVVVVLTLNPAELLRQSRDANRVSDMATLNSAINLYATDQSGASGFSMGSSTVVYVSIPDPAATSTAGTNCATIGLPTLPSTYTYHCAASSTYRNVNGQGWIPITFSNISSGSPLGSLPVDPINSTSSRLYYTFDTNGSQFEVTAAMESAKYQAGGSNDVISTDGGPLASVYEKGTLLGLEPLDYGDPTLVGYWPLNEGTGTVAYDMSGNNATGSWSGTQSGNNGTYYVSGYNQAYAGTFATSSSNFISVPDSSGALNFGVQPFTLSVWVNYSNGSPAGFLSDSAVYNSCGYFLGVSGNQVRFVFNWAGNDSEVWPSSGSIINAWTDIAITYNGSQIIFYENGLQVASGTGDQIASCGTKTFYIGKTFQGGWASYMGSLQNVRVFNRVLSAAQIQAMYNGSK